MRNEKLFIMEQPELGQKILDLRKSKGFTQEELVEKCNINVRTIQRIEAGEVTPRSYTIKIILEVLGVDYDAIIKKNIKEEKDDFYKIKENTISKELNIAWLSGIFYFFIGLALIFILYENKTNLLEIRFLYSFLRLLSIISFIFFIRGFIIIGHLKKDYFLKIVAFIISLLYIFFGTIEIVSDTINTHIYTDFIRTLQTIAFGVFSLLLGCSVLNLKNKYGYIALIAGILEIMSGLFLLSFSNKISISIIFPMQILEIILLVKAATVYKSISN